MQCPSLHIPLSVLPVVEVSAAPITGKMVQVLRRLIDHLRYAIVV